MIQIFKSTTSIVKTFVAASFLAAFIFSCRTAEVALNADLQTDTDVYQVKGRQGFRVGQVLTFGDFKTSKVGRGWTFAYAIPFIVSFKGAKEKLSFQQSDKDGNVADVALVSKLRETDLSLAKDFFSVSLQYNNYFAGSVRLYDAQQSWEFIVYNVDGQGRSLNNRETVGFVRNGRTRVDINAINALNGSSGLITQGSVYGYEFAINGRLAGAVSTINNGKVWMKNGLDDETRLVLASVASGLMLRSQLEDHAL